MCTVNALLSLNWIGYEFCCVTEICLYVKTYKHINGFDDKMLSVALIPQSYPKRARVQSKENMNKSERNKGKGGRQNRLSCSDARGDMRKMRVRFL